MILQRIAPRFAIGPGGRTPPLSQSDDPGRKDPRLETRILIIEDEMMIAWMLESLLLDAGFSDIAMAADYDEACRISANEIPGLVVSDINLGSGNDGVEASVAICHAAAIPVLFVTAYADDATRQRIARHFPKAELLRKPIDGVTLLQAVNRSIDQRHNH